MKLNSNFVLMFRIIQHIKFLLTSTNQHGVHSPFVYKLVTQCLYKKSRRYFTFKALKRYRIIDNLIHYFKPKNALLIGADDGCETLFLNQNMDTDRIDNIQNLTTDLSEKYDIIFIESPELIDKRLNEIIKFMKNDSAMILNNLSSLNKNISLFEKIKQNKQVTVTINCFILGLVFIRREQNKQHFNIRL